MKKKILYFSLVALLSAFQCDDEYIPDYVVDADSLIEVENSQTEFLVGDYIVINTEIANKQVTTKDQSINIKDFLIGNELNLYYSLALYRLNAENEEIPYFVEVVDEEDGFIEFNDQNPFFNISSSYNETEDNFKSKIGIKLTEAGDYLLKSGISRFGVQVIVFDLNGSSSVGSLQVNTSILNAYEDGVYRFTVQ